MTDNRSISLQDFKADKEIDSLHSMVAGGIMTPSEGEEKIYMIKEKEVLKVHTRSINQRSDGRYITKVKCNNSLLQKSADTRKELIDKLFDFYFGISNATLEMLYPLWMEYRRTETSRTEKTIKENGFLWNAYLQGHPITHKPIRTLNSNDYSAFFHSITKDREMTQKRFNDLKSVMNGILYYAVKKEIITHNPLLDINYTEFSYKAERRITMPYTEKERLMILDYVPDNDLYDLAIKLAFYSILRIGELKGLRFDDIQDDYICVQRFVNDKNEIQEDIKGHTSYGIRLLPITPECMKIIEKIKELNPNNEYLFFRDEKPLSTCTFNRRLRKYCEELGIKYRSSHKIRFSTASILYANGVSDTELQGMLGHSTLAMTHYYLKNITPKEKTFKKVVSTFG